MEGACAEASETSDTEFSQREEKEKRRFSEHVGADRQRRIGSRGGDGIDRVERRW